MNLNVTDPSFLLVTRETGMKLAMAKITHSIIRIDVYKRTSFLHVSADSFAGVDVNV